MSSKSAHKSGKRRRSTERKRSTTSKATTLERRAIRAVKYGSAR